MKCCVPGCHINYNNRGLHTFHSFPQNEERRKEWMRLTKTENIASSSVRKPKICSGHFKPECFNAEKFGGTWLRSDAKPTIFNFFEPENISAPVPVCHIITNKRKSYVGDFEDEDMEDPKQAKKLLRIAKITIEKNNARIKDLQQRNRRLVKRVKKFKSILTDLKKKSYVSNVAHDVLQLQHILMQNPINAEDLPSNRSDESSDNSDIFTSDLCMEVSENFNDCVEQSHIKIPKKISEIKKEDECSKDNPLIIMPDKCTESLQIENFIKI